MSIVSLTYFCYWTKQATKFTFAQFNSSFANSVDLDEVAHNEPPHQDPHCLPSSLWISIWYSLDLTFFENLQGYDIKIIQTLKGKVTVTL